MNKQRVIKTIVQPSPLIVNILTLTRENRSSGGRGKLDYLQPPTHNNQWHVNSAKCRDCFKNYDFRTVYPYASHPLCSCRPSHERRYESRCRPFCTLDGHRVFNLMSSRTEGPRALNERLQIRGRDYYSLY